MSRTFAVVTAFDRTATVERVAILSEEEASLVTRRLKARGWVDDEHGRGLVDDACDPTCGVTFLQDHLSSADAVLDFVDLDADED